MSCSGGPDIEKVRISKYTEYVSRASTQLADHYIHYCGMHAHLLLFSKCFTGSLEDYARLDL
jgi:hypothetical protein